jgi:predicted membrane protein
LQELRVDGGAAQLEVRQLGNANAEHVRVECGVGDVTLDLSGAWARDAQLSLEVALGNTTLRVPRDVGVRIRLDKVLASFEHPGFTRRGDLYYSANYDAAARKVSVDASTVFGGFEVEWLPH